MKKLIFLSIFFIVLSTYSFAQEANRVETVIEQQPISPFETNAKKNLADLKAVTKINPELETSLFQLFKSKNKMIFNAEGSSERIEIIRNGISQKLKGLLGESAFNSVKSNTALFDSLMK